MSDNVGDVFNLQKEMNERSMLRSFEDKKSEQENVIVHDKENICVHKCCDVRRGMEIYNRESILENILIDQVSPRSVDKPIFHQAFRSSILFDYQIDTRTISVYQQQSY